MITMKHLHLYSLALLILFGNVQAATIFEIQSDVAVYASSVEDKTGDYYDQTFTDFASSTALTKNQLAADVTGSDLTKYAWTPNANLSNPVGNSYIDLAFSGNIYNGIGDDLVLFFAGTGTTFKDGHAEPYLFSVDIGADDTIEALNQGVITSSTSDIYGDLFFASYAMIDLDDYGFDQQTPLGTIRLHLGDTSMPALAALGAYHTTAVVPLPLPVILFSSGLALLGWIGRRKRI